MQPNHRNTTKNTEWVSDVKKLLSNGPFHKEKFECNQILEKIISSVVCVFVTNSAEPEAVQFQLFTSLR